MSENMSEMEITIARERERKTERKESGRCEHN